MNTIMGFIKNSFGDYVKILKYLWNVIKNEKLLSMVIRKEWLAVGREGNVIHKVYDLL